MTVKLLQGDALAVLRTLPTASVHCCVTSPPYFGLRSYGTAPHVWDGVEGCAHVWGAAHQRTLTEQTCYVTGRAAGEPFAPGKKLAVGDRPVSQGAFCQSCPAWRGSLGLEPTPELYTSHLVQVFAEVRRVLRPDGTLWLVLGDSYTSGGRATFGPGTNKGQPKNAPRAPQPVGVREKNLLGIPWRVAFALQAEGWVLRSEITWVKRAPMPESVQDRPTSATEKVFLLAQQGRYYFDMESVKTPAIGQNHHDLTGGRYAPPGQTAHSGSRNGATPHGASMRNYLLLGPEPFSGAHFAVMPTALVMPCVLAGSPPGGTTLDPFCGSGTVGLVCSRLGRDFIGIDLNEDYCRLAEQRIRQDAPLFAEVSRSHMVLPSHDRTDISQPDLLVD